MRFQLIFTFCLFGLIANAKNENNNIIALSNNNKLNKEFKTINNQKTSLQPIGILKSRNILTQDIVDEKLCATIQTSNKVIKYAPICIKKNIKLKTKKD